MDELERILEARKKKWHVGDRVMFGFSRSSGEGHAQPGRIVRVDENAGYPYEVALDARCVKQTIRALPEELSEGLPPLTTVEQVDDFLEEKF